MVSYVEAQLPADAQLLVGVKVALHGYILMADASYSVTSQITDYSIRQIGTARPRAADVAALVPDACNLDRPPPQPAVNIDS